MVRPEGARGGWPPESPSQVSPSQEKRYVAAVEARGGYVALTQRGRGPLGGAVMDASCAHAPVTRFIR
eukprot:3166511-Pyramimonas_sp.AAC.1